MAALIDRCHQHQREATLLGDQLRDARAQYDAERDAHLATLRTLSERYRRAGKAIPEHIYDAIVAREVPF